jgi:hypothetical protein
LVFSESETFDELVLCISYSAELAYDKHRKESDEIAFHADSTTMSVVKHELTSLIPEQPLLRSKNTTSSASPHYSSLLQYFAI